MKRWAFIIAAFVSSGCSYSLSKIRILKYPGEPLGNIYDSMNIKRVRAAYNCDSIVVRLKDRRKLILNPDTVWGFQDTDSSFWRYSDGSFIKVRQLDTPSIYSVHHSAGKTSHTDYFFSKTPFSAVYSLKWKNIKREFADDSCFLFAQRHLGFFRSYESYDNKNKQYRFVQSYKDCRNRTFP